MMAVGVPLLLGSTTSSSVALLLLTPISLWRIGREESVLRLVDEEGEKQGADDVLRLPPANGCQRQLSD
jgi:hypothetical protein